MSSRFTQLEANTIHHHILDYRLSNLAQKITYLILNHDLLYFFFLFIICLLQIYIIVKFKL